MHRDPLPTVLEAARAASPGVRLDDATFARHLADRVAPRPVTAAVVAEVHTGDLFLACACSRRDPAALALLEARFLSRLPRSLVRVDASPAFADEVLQLLRHKLLSPDGGGRPRILDYAGRGPLLGWLRAAAVRTALNLRQGRRHADGLELALEDDLAGRAADPEQALMMVQLRDQFRQALGHAFRSLASDERNLLRLHVVEGLSIDRLAVMFRIHRSTAARRVERLREWLREETRRHLAERVGLGERELESALRHVHSAAEPSGSWLAP